MDYRDFQEKGAQYPDRTIKRWWEEEDAKKAALAAWKQQEALENQQSYRREELTRYARLFGNRDLAGMGIAQYARASPDSHKKSSSQNVVKSCCESITAMTCASRPRPLYLTDNGDFNQREKAKTLNKFTRGQFYEANYYAIATKTALFAAVFGTGVIKSLEINGRAGLENTFVGNLFVDETEAIWGNPRQMYQSMPIARDVLRGMFPDADESVISKAATEKTDGLVFAGDMVRVVEAWHLRSSDESKDGKHLICTSEGVLGEVDDWTLDYFPFSFLTWGEPLAGFWGNGIAEQLMGKQLEINKLASRIQRIMHFSVPRVFVPGGAKIPKNHLTNDILDVVEYQGTQPPVIMAPTMVPPEYFKRMADLKSESYEEVGISQMMASGTKPAGLNSGRAQREHADIQNARFVVFGQKYEQLSLDVARNLIQLTRSIAEREDEDGKKKGYKVRMPDKKFIERVDWSDIELGEDEYVMQCFPVSSLPRTPEARQETVADWVQQGWCSAEEGRRLLDFPDLEQSSNLAVAALDNIDKTIDDMLAGKDYRPPEPFQDLHMGIKRAMSAYLRASTENYPPKRLENLQTWILQAQGSLAPPQPSGPPAANQDVPAPPDAPPGPQGPPPGPALPGPDSAPPAPPIAA